MFLNAFQIGKWKLIWNNDTMSCIFFNAIKQGHKLDQTFA